MNKQELISEVAEMSGLMKKDAEKAVNATFSVIENALVAGDNVRLLGFGTFEVRKRKERVGRNPRKPGEKIMIPASKSAALKIGKDLKDKLNK